MKNKTKQEILDKQAQEHGYDDFEQLLCEFDSTKEVTMVVLDAMAAYSIQQNLKNLPK